MTTARYDVVAIGNAIVDIIGRCDDAFLARHGAPKGHMRLVDAETSAALYAAMGSAVLIRRDGTFPQALRACSGQTRS